VVIAVAGTAYTVGDTLTLVGGTFTTAAQLIVRAIDAVGGVTYATISVRGSYSVKPTDPVVASGGTGIVNVTFNVTWSEVANGAVTANISVVPSGGTAVATYAGRVWVASNRTVVFSAPTSFNDFSSTSGGGSFIVVDETLHSTIQALVSANNFLYILGSSSVNVVADVSIVNGVTVFSNTNISASVGTNQPHSVMPYYRALWFASPYGIYALYGSTTQKASDDLDGIFPLITGAISITSGTAVLNNILTLCFMFKYNDPVLGARTIIACFSNKKWFIASQGDSMTNIDTAIISGSPVMYATDGSYLYKMFGDATIGVNQTIVTKLWDMGDPLSNKQTIKFGLEVINPGTPQDILGTIDTEYSAGAFPIDLTNSNVVTWVNDTGAIVEWVNDSGAVVQWISSGYAFMPMDVQTVGRYIGVTLNSSSPGTVYAGLHLQYEHRTQWPEGGAQ
jgi:hypothetical protein